MTAAMMKTLNFLTERWLSTKKAPAAVAEEQLDYVEEKKLQKDNSDKAKSLPDKKSGLFFDRNVQNRSIKLVHKDPVPPKPKMPDSASSKNKD